MGDAFIELVAGLGAKCGVTGSPSLSLLEE
jgi:hypothetical protein